MNIEKHFKKYPQYERNKVTEYYIVTYLININHELFATYNYYQELLKSLKYRYKIKFFSIINNDSSDIFPYAKKCNKTLLNMKNYLINAFDYDLSDGLIEETNNVINQIKYTAYGYRKFSHLKAIVMLIKGLYNPLIT